MVWVKQRNSAQSHRLYDTSRGVSQMIASNTTSAQANTAGFGVTSFSSSGFTLVDDASNYGVNFSGNTYASWTFREAPKFFDIVTYTGNGANRNIAHSLGVAPGCIIVKRTDAAADWQVYHRSNANTEYMVLNTTAAKATGTTRWNSTTPTATEFTVGTDTTVNANGGTYVAYLFAHDTTSDGIIQCGSFTTDGSGNATVNLGWEPQWVLSKNASAVQFWWVVDCMRQWEAGYGNTILQPQSSASEAGYFGTRPNATGFDVSGLSGSQTYIYIAIRRGPMRTPTLGTSVFSPVNIPSTVSGSSVVTNFPVDLAILTQSTNTGARYIDRLRGGGLGASPYIPSYNTSAEANSVAGQGLLLSSNTGYLDYWTNTQYGSARNATYYNFRRAPSFFDEVCYTGTGVATTFNHNLGVAPELIIAKCRSSAFNWTVYSSALGNSFPIFLNSTSAGTTNYGALMWGSTAPTATQFPVGTYTGTNNSGSTYVAYLFASAPGVSKVGSYTGTGTTQTINCGFTTGARFVLIKRTDSTGDWYVWDSARGIVAGNDPYLLLNTLDPEYTGTDYVDTDNSGFQISSTAPAAINANGGTFIYLAIS